MDAEVEAPASGINSLIDNVARGNFKDEVNKSLQGLVADIATTGRPGKISLEINIRPNRNTGTVEVSGEVKVKAPKAQVPASIFFIGPDNNLSRYDSRQLEIFHEPAA